MKRRWKITVVALAIVAIVAAIALTNGDSEPRYDGRTLSKWMSAYAEEQQTLEQPEQGPAAHALRSIGTNALPLLIKWTSFGPRYSHQRGHPVIWSLAEKIGFGEKYARYVNADEERAFRALATFALLGTNAAPVAPHFSNMVVNARSTDSAVRAMVTLTWLGSAGTKTQIALLANTNNPYRAELAGNLESNKKEDDDAVRNALLLCLQDSDPNVRNAATNALKRISALQ